MRESAVENKLRNATKQHGGIALKFTSPGLAGVPDRLIILPDGKYAFVEVKRPGGKTRPIQEIRHQQLRNLGCMVRVIDHPNQIQELLHEIQQQPTFKRCLKEPGQHP